MAESAAAGRRRVIVIPRGLEEFFYDRLCRRYAGRCRRDDPRRPTVGRAPRDRQAVFPDAERSERRRGTGDWVLPEMPFETQRPFSAS